MHGRRARPPRKRATGSDSGAWPRRVPGGAAAGAAGATSLVGGEPRARIHLTGSGGWGILTCLAVAMAAANTANNLLYLLLALMMAAYAVSAWISRRTLARLSGEIVASREMRQGDPAEIVASVRAARGRAPGVVLELKATDAAGWQWAPSSVRSIPLVAADAASSVALPAFLGRRGPARLRLVARSPFPFGLIEGLRVLADEEILVLPLADPAWRRAVHESQAEGAPAPRKGEGTDIFNIRDYSWGEDARRMDWKATARLGRPMLREYARESQRSVVLLIPSLPPPAQAALPEDDPAERLISRAAGAAEDLEREGWRLRLLAPGTDVRGDSRAILRALARLRPAAAPEGWWRGSVEPGEPVLDLTRGPAPFEAIPA